MKRLIILRGNSGSGKTTVAKLLQEQLGRHTMLISQDVIRRQVLRVKENTKHPTMKLIQQMTQFGWGNGYETVILEGIFGAEKNGSALKQLIAEAEEGYVYYFDIPFDETLRRHATKLNADEFGEKEMREWWKEKDVLDVPNERMIYKDKTAEEIVDTLVKQIQK